MEHLLPAGADVRTLLGDDFDVREGRARNGTTTFYDTFDGRLHADGVTLRHTDGRLALLDRETGDELASRRGDRRAPAVHGRPARAAARAARGRDRDARADP